jgi:5-methylcytosine-specific restriction enzyme subunit McrC
MNNTPKIPIRNIYYMLCYAWDILDQKDTLALGTESLDNIYNLLSRVYISGVTNLLKRGLNRNYIEEAEEMPMIKGKINITSSLKRQSFRFGKAVCIYDDFSHDIVLNQIIKRTINILLKTPELDNNLKIKLNKLVASFQQIQDISLTDRMFSTLRFDRNNHHYVLLMNISELIYKGLITKEEGDQLRFSDFIREKQMAKLYEKFVLNFYKKHLDNNYRVHSPKINWKIDESVTDEDLALLPTMLTDIVVEDKKNNTQLIIDTKYYSQTLISSKWSELKKVRTAHLYQIYAYIHHSTYDGYITGMLLYPTVEKEINTIFPMSKTISIKTLNLDTEWKNIERRLISLIQI